MRVCECHGEPMLFRDKWRCVVKRRASEQRATKRYLRTPKGKAAKSRYNTSEKGRQAQERYFSTPHGFAMRVARTR